MKDGSLFCRWEIQRPKMARGTVARKSRTKEHHDVTRHCYVVHGAVEEPPHGSHEFRPRPGREVRRSQLSPRRLPDLPRACRVRPLRLASGHRPQEDRSSAWAKRGIVAILPGARDRNPGDKSAW